ncbi:MAG: DNA polymerase III subunit gamma/tau, partial [Bacteroidetes bacterium]|nr:DNA polymerase III subunit gamma/tau [Bacteroidota bacterium]
MDSYIVSARKYRPATFKSVVGQEVITSTLKNAIRTGQLAQAYLFCGPRGVGKTTCARILAKTLNCVNVSGETEPCNSCDNCKAFNENASFNIHEMDGASNNGVDEIRALIEKVRFAPQSGKYSVFIIDEVHMLSSSAFNAFLKTLEEPPPHAIFILATTERHKILPTILSRCQVFTFNRIGVDDIANHLAWVAAQEQIEAEPEALHVIAQKADGGLRDALSMFDQIVSFSGQDPVTYLKTIENLHVLDYDVYFKLTESIWNGKIHEALILFDQVLAQGFDDANFIAGFAEHLRNLLVCQDASTLVLLETGEAVKSRYQLQSATCKPVQLIKALDILSEAENKLRFTRNHRLQVELALMQICLITTAQPSAEKKSPEPAAQINQPVQAAPASAPVAKVMNFRTRPEIKTVSVKGVTQKLAEQTREEEKSGETIITGIEDLPSDAFTQDELRQVWNAYCDILVKDKRNAMAGNLTLGEPVLTSE